MRIFLLFPRPLFLEGTSQVCSADFLLSFECFPVKETLVDSVLLFLFMGSVI